MGWSCLGSDGLYEMYTADGLQSLGFTHGPDLVNDVAGQESEYWAPPREAHCVSGAAGTYYVQVIYARAINDFDEYANKVPGIRDLVKRANGLVEDAAVRTGGTADLKVKCVNGQIEVKNEVLLVPIPVANFQTITLELRNRGYNDIRVKYWIFYDDTTGCAGCAGQGNVFGDSSPGVGNSNNGNAGPMYAITYGYSSVLVMLHELGHILGAVQNNAPHTTGGFHCVDGLDIMCYNDDGPNSHLYSATVCQPEEVWDCRNDDYFNRNPAPGTYLANNWNLANSVNRYHEFGRPVLQLLSCPSSIDVGDTATCTVRAFDDSSGVRYNIDWGDGASSCIPSCAGFTAPNVDQTASHTYGVVGGYDVVVTATDNGSPTRVSPAKSTTIGVGDLLPPTLVVTDPAPGKLYSSCFATPAPGQPQALALFQACAKGTAVDVGGSGLDRVEVFYNGVLNGKSTFSPYAIIWDVEGPAEDQEVRIRATDNAGNFVEQTFFIDVLS